MNNDPSPPPAAAQNLPLSSSSNLPSSSDPVADISTAREARQDALGPAQKSAQAQTKKKYEFINTLMTNLDVLIYAELCVVYYMEYSSPLLTPIYEANEVTVAHSSASCSVPSRK